MNKLVLVMLFAAACGKSADKAPPSDPPAGSGSAVVAPVDGANVAAGSGSGSGSAVPAADVDVPTSMDYEDLANEEITDKTVEARLKALETELAPAN